MSSLLRTLLTILFLSGMIAPAASPGGMVVAQEGHAARIGAKVLADGGNAVDAAVATAFAMAVTHPIAGNIGGGGFLLLRLGNGRTEVIDFRETAPSGSHPKMFLKDGRYDQFLHHESYLSVGVPGTVRGLHAAWQRHGKMPWRRLLEPAERLAAEGFLVSETLATSLKTFLPMLQKNPAARAQFSRDGQPLVVGDTLRQSDLARTLARIAKQGPDGFYKGETAELIVREMQANGGLITARDLARYRAAVRKPLRGSYRGFEVLCVPPPSGGGIALLEILNQVEGCDLKALGADTIATQHLKAEAMRRAFADRARWIGDPAFNPSIPLNRLGSKAYAASLRSTIDPERASISSPERFTWAKESEETTHLSVVDAQMNAVSLTYTLEDNYGSRIVVPGAGFLLNNEMGDFNGEPGRTDATGLIGTKPNLASPRKRMLSSMSPTILAKNGKLFMVTGSPGGRTIPNTTVQTILNVVDFGL
ncbi:MAG: gamma-glutamyltransferase, partial [Holophaga sp.]|nr:gamma-glutamyltransferase [Holophaga sp.]